MKRKLLMWIAPAAISVHTACFASPLPGGYDIACPAILEREVVTFAGASAPNGWKPYMPSRLEVESGFLMYGPPETLETSKPTSWKDGKLADTSTWDFSELPSDEKWISCGYGAGRELTLSKALPRDVSTCTVTTTKNERGWVTGVAVHCEKLRSKR